LNRPKTAGCDHGAFAGSAFGASAGLLSGAAVEAFGAGFLASPQPVTATTATNNVAANSCFIVHSPDQLGKTVTRHRGDSLNITMS
jgi:hypothetical protein